MTPSLSPDLRNRLVVAYLGHRLNHSELVDLLRRAESAEAGLEDQFERYASRDIDWRGEVTPEQLSQAWEKLGLAEQYRGLDESSVWSSLDRAAYRRLSQPQHDPPTDPAPAAPTALDSRILEQVERSFPDWNRDGNLHLDKHELDFLLSGGAYGEKLSESNDPEKAAVMATLLGNHRLLSSGDVHDGGGISVLDLRFWSGEADTVQHGAMAALNDHYEEYRERAHEMVQGRPLLEENLDGGEIRQGVVGSCVLLSTAAGTRQEDLREMFEQADGAHVVRFADGKVEQVSEPSLAARLHHSQGENGERWPAILEIAAAQRLLQERREQGEPVPPEGLRGAIEGIDPGFAIRALTGREAVQRSLDELTLVQTRELLGEAMTSGGPVICASRPTANGDFINEEELHNGIANGHCYRICSYDQEKDTVRLQNPWHKQDWLFAHDGQDDGVFEMPLMDFYASYRWLAFAARPNVRSRCQTLESRFDRVFPPQG